MDTKQKNFWVGVATCGFGLMTVFLLLWQKSQERFSVATKEIEALNQQLISRDQSIAELNARIGQLEDKRQPAIAQSPPVNGPSATDVLEQLEHLAARQDRILTTLESVTAAMTNSSPLPKPTSEQRQRAVIVLERQVQEHQAELEKAKLRVVELLASLGVPYEVSAMDIKSGLDDVQLIRYWPYFEAKRASNELDDYVNLLQRKLRIEKVESALSP